MKNRIRKLRLEKSLTQKELGQAMELAESTISLYEAGKREPDITTLIRLAHFFSVSIDYILYLTDDPTPAKERSAGMVQGDRSYDDLTPEQIEKIKSYEAFLRSEQKKDT